MAEGTTQGELARSPREFDIAGAAWTLVRTEFLVRYHGTAMGFLWALLKPLAMLAVLLGVFWFIFSSTPDYAIRLTVGLFLYDYFQEGTKWGLISLTHKGFLLNKSRFPRWIFVVTATANPLITLCVACTGIVAVLCLCGRAPDPLRLALFVSYILHYVAIVIGFSLATSVLFVRYRDLNQVWEVVLQAGFFVAPIIYPLGILPERFHLVLYAWPPTAIIEFSRAVLIGGAIPTLKAHLLLSAMTLAFVAAGVACYQRFVPRAAEYL